jgi:hypothetical protein
MRRHSKRALCGGAAAALACGGLLIAAPGTASAKDNGALTMAIFGDAPYGTSNADTAEFGDTPAFIDQINADPDVSSVVHVGDIHSGKQYCTQGYDQSVANLWTRFQDSLVYTPGDNEWADCHKPAEGGHVTANGSPVDYAGGDPVANLDLVRSTFFSNPGRTLGQGNLTVQSQATAYDPAHPEDAAYVENVRWQRKGVEFVTVNVPGGSNNDADPWFGAPLTDRQTAERVARTAADLRWLDAAFAEAAQNDAHGVVVITQADMWDVDGNTAAHLTNYEPIVKSLADHTNALGRPVLLFNGDSHVYRSDNPFSATAPCETEGATAGSTVACDPTQQANEAATHPGYTVPNFHRITVHGSTFPLEWLKLTISPRQDGTFGPFSWQRMTTGLGS